MPEVRHGRIFWDHYRTDHTPLGEYQVVTLLAKRRAASNRHTPQSTYLLCSFSRVLTFASRLSLSTTPM